MKKAKIYTVTSVKGGTGKTTFTLNLAAAFKLQNKKVLVMDLDTSAGDVAARLNVECEKDLYHLYEDIQDHVFDKIENYIYPYAEGIDIIGAPKDPRRAGKIEASFLPYIFSKVSLKYDVILIDTNHMLSQLNLTAFDYSDDILFVMNSECMNMRAMRTMSTIFEDMESDRMVILLNDSNNKTVGEYSVGNIQNIIKRDIDFRIPQSFFQKKYDKYTMDGVIFLLEPKIRRKCKRAARVFDLIATTLVRED